MAMVEYRKANKKHSAFSEEPITLKKKPRRTTVENERELNLKLIKFRKRISKEYDGEAPEDK